MNKNVLIVGAGLSGCTVAAVLAENGYNVTIIEKRDTVGGNVYDFVDENGIRIQKYGPHIFHTNDKTVFQFLSKYTQWTRYEHKVLGNIKGKLVPVPFNLKSLEELYPADKAEKIKKILLEEIGEGKKVPILVLRQHKDELIREFAEFVYQNVFYHYTMKQWGFKPEELGETVMNRVPVYISYEDRYFTDTYQYQPTDGFTPMVERMLENGNIKVCLGTDALECIEIRDDTVYFNRERYDGKVVFTGRIDELFREKYGALAYRSLRFEFETHNESSYQPCAVVNYNTSEDFTRISEFSKFCCEPQKKTVIVKEYSKTCGENDIPYYPIPKAENKAEYEKYANDAAKVGGLYLAGRLAGYKYVNMDVAVADGLALAEKIMAENE